jgi:hypothetical protein
MSRDLLDYFMVDQMEDINKLQEKVSKLQEEFENLLKHLHSKEEEIKKRNEGFTRIIVDLDKTDKPSNDDINRFEGYYTYIVSYDLKDLIERKNWFVGVLLSTSIMEDVGKRKLKRMFKDKIDSNRIENLTFEQMTIMLFASGLVDYDIYQKLMNIKKVRNDLAHDSHKAMMTFLQTGSMDSKFCEECKSAINKAIFCLEKINPPVTPSME